MPPGSRERLIAVLWAAVRDAIETVEIKKRTERQVLRDRARDFVLDLPESHYLPVEDFAAGLLCALVGPADNPDLVFPAVLIVHRVLSKALIGVPSAEAFAPLRQALEPQVKWAEVLRFFQSNFARLSAAPAFR